MRRKKIIGDDEYSYLIQRLGEINNEEKLLASLSFNDAYKAHVLLPNSFLELMIYLKRENEKIDNKLCLYYKKLVSFSGIKLSYDDLIQLICQNDIPDFLLNDSCFLNFLPLIQELMDIKKANVFLYQYVDRLIQERDSLLSLKICYEKNKKKLINKKPIILKK